jgi:hypothetical protein
LSEAITGIVSNPNLTEGDVRLILDGRSLSDPQQRTREVPIEAVQTIGRMLTRGETQAESARAARVSLNTVEAIDEFLGLTQAYQDRLMDSAVLAVREGWSVRQLARDIEVSISGNFTSRHPLRMMKRNSRRSKPFFEADRPGGMNNEKEDINR